MCRDRMIQLLLSIATNIISKSDGRGKNESIGFKDVFTDKLFKIY
jgi:hypothetical protein